MEFIPNAGNGWGMAHAENGLNSESLHQLGHDLGLALATLHDVHLGYITHFATKVDSWKQAVTDGFSPDWDHIAPNKLFDSELLPIFERILDKTRYFSFQDGTFVHGDLVLSNVLVDLDSHRLKAIIDPGSNAGMPMFDLAYAAMPWDHGFDFHYAMLDAYREHSDHFDPITFYVSMLVVAYRHDRFHTPTVREHIFQKILPNLDF
jgi:aminoglycoside phosphotransferase (APT) family kinase protein